MRHGIAVLLVCIDKWHGELVVKRELDRFWMMETTKTLRATNDWFADMKDKTVAAGTRRQP